MEKVKNTFCTILRILVALNFLVKVTPVSMTPVSMTLKKLVCLTSKPLDRS